MRRQLLALVAATALTTLASPVWADDYVLMKVNSQDVTKTEVDRMWAGLFPAGQAPELEAMQPQMRDKILRGVMTERLLLGEALKQGVDKSDAVAKELEEVKRKLVVRHFLEAKTSDISEADLKREYETMVASMRDQKEVRARHILVSTEAEAKDVKKKLDDGKKFEDVAREYSKDPGSAKQGGDLGYFTKDKMVKPFADAAFSMKKGAVSEPVKSQFGWHVIKVEDSRPVTIPTYNQVKEQLRVSLQEKKLNDYIRGLVKDAEVKVYDAKGEELPFSKDIPAEKDAAKKD
ncbi:MAG: peptidylprolyl isomerase [Azospirillum brasilense]|nr:MAG: peptidylprolyl isomerase [Azospirillum brasilense]